MFLNPKTTDDHTIQKMGMNTLEEGRRQVQRDISIIPQTTSRLDFSTAGSNGAFLRKTDSQLFCTRPFEWIEIHPLGDVFLCCPSWLKRSIGNLFVESAFEIWYSSVATDIRKSISNGSFHNCNRKRCPHLQSLTAPVSRKNGCADIGKQPVPSLPDRLNLCYDHSCNLSCPSCRRQTSQASGKVLERAQAINHIICRDLLPTAREITLSGFGDPFGSSSYRELLERINHQSCPYLSKLRLHTNGQSLTPQTWQNLQCLRDINCSIEISMDAATDKTYQLNRRGGNFARLMSNLEFLATTESTLKLSMVVQQNNWREIPLFIRIARQYNAKTYFSQLVNWGTFSRSEYAQRAVHLPAHPKHRSFIDLLRKLPDTIDLGNFGSLFSDLHQ